MGMHSGVRDRAFLKDNQIARSGAEIGEADPSSRSSERSTESAQASGSKTVSSTCTPALFTAVTTFWVALEER